MFKAIKKVIRNWQEKRRMEDVEFRFLFLLATRYNKTAKSYAMSILDGSDAYPFKKAFAIRHSNYPYCRRWLWGNGDAETVNLLIGQRGITTKSELKAAAVNPVLNRELVNKILLEWNHASVKAQSKFLTLLPDGLVNLTLLRTILKEVDFNVTGKAHGIAEKAIAGRARKLLECDENIPDNWVIKLL
jgi:hypothetical protein